MVKEFSAKDFPENAVMLKLNKNYKRYIEIVGNLNPRDFLLYEASRGYWRMNAERASKMKYAMPVYDGKILTVYEVDKWYPAGTTPRKGDFVDNGFTNDEQEFIGWLAKDEILLHYINQPVNSYRNPVHYAENEN